MNDYGIIVEYEIEDGRDEEFLALITDHARRTREEEPGCLRFEVLRPVKRSGAAIPNRFMVNELYAGMAAIEAHEASQRLARLREALAPLVKSRRLVMMESLEQRTSEEGIRPQDLSAANDD